MQMFNVIEYSINYAITTASLQQYDKDILRDNITDSKSFKSKAKKTGRTPADSNIKDAKIAMSLECWVTFGGLLKCHRLFLKSISY